MELADPVPAEDRDRTAAFRNPEKPQKPPIKTYTLDKAVIGLIARYYVQNGLIFEEKEVRNIYSLHSFRVLATNLLLKAGAPRHVICSEGGHPTMDTYTREELTMMEFMRRQSSKCAHIRLQEPPKA